MAVEPLRTWAIEEREDLTSDPRRTIVREGDIVYRTSGPWTPTVHALLRYLRDAGFANVPKPLGCDGQGREMLAFVPGESGPAGWSKIVDDAGLRRFARLLRSYHDAVREFVPAPDATWAFDDRSHVAETIICHGDFGPWNIVWQGDDPAAIIDWDFAGPGIPMDDIAYALEYAAPFRSDDEALRGLRYRTAPDRRHRIEVFASAYGLDSIDGLVDRVIDRQRLDRKRVAHLAGSGREPQASWAREGYLNELSARIQWSERWRDAND